MKNLKSTLYPILILALLLGFASLGLGWLQFTVWIEPESSVTSSLPEVEPSATPAIQQVKRVSPTLPQVTPMLPTPVASPSKSPDPVAVAAYQGSLRVSNPTERP